MAVTKKKSKVKSKALPKKSSPVKQSAAKSAPGKKAPAKKAVKSKTPVKKNVASKAPAKKAKTKQSAPAKKVRTKKSAPAKSVPGKKAAPAAKSSAPSIVDRVKAAVQATVKASTDMVDKYLRSDANPSLTPLDDRILVQVAAPEVKTAGGLFIPTTVETKPSRGKVIAVGKGKRGKKGNVRPLDVVVGDFVLFAAYAGEPVTLNGSEYLILREEDVLGVSES